MKTYAGIGSRSTPEDVLRLMTALASTLRTRGWTLRSGNAEGADLAFQLGAGADAEVYVPWPTFGPAFQPGSTGHMPTDEAMYLAEVHHPNWAACSQAARKLHARNMHQVLGGDLATPVSFVVCWTPDGSLDGMGRNVGGTGQALRLAHAHGIEVVNLARDEHRERVMGFVLSREVAK